MFPHRPLFVCGPAGGRSSAWGAAALRGLGQGWIASLRLPRPGSC